MHRTGIVGRDAELSLVDAFVRSDGVLVVDGLAGMGRSEIARYAARAARDAGRQVVVLDDAHKSLDRAARILAAPEQTAVLTTRNRHAEFERLLAGREDVVQRLHLGPLADDDADELARTIAGGEVSTAGTGGNPQLIKALARGLRDEHALGCDLVPTRVFTVVQAWLAELSVKGQQLLRVGAVLGESFRLSDAVGLLRETAAMLLPALDEALGSGMLVGADESLAFRYELVRRATSDSLPLSVRRALLAEAEQLRSAELRPGSWSARQDAQVVDLVRGLIAAGDIDAAVRAARSALAGVLPDRVAVTLRCTISDALVMAGRAAEGVAEAETVLAQPELSAHAGAEALAAWVFGRFMLDGGQVREETSEILAGRQYVGGDVQAIVAATAQSNVDWANGRLAGGLRWGREAVRGAELVGPPGWPRLALATKLGEVFEFEQAEALISDAREYIAHKGAVAHTSAPMVVRSRMLLRAGRLAEAQDEAEAAVRTAAELGTPLLAPLAHSVLVQVALHSKDIDAAARHVRRMRAELSPGRVLFPSGLYDFVELLVTHAQSGPEAASDLLDAVGSSLAWRTSLLVQEPGAAAWFIRLARAVGREGLARNVVEASERLAAANPGFETVEAGARHARSLFDRDEAGLAHCAAEHCDAWARTTAQDDLEELLSLRRSGSTPAAPEPRRPDSHKVVLRDLTPTERDIASLVSEGLTNRQVAKRVHLSPHTVNYHLRSIFKKLNINSRIELVHLVHR